MHTCLLQKRFQGSISTCREVPTLVAASEVLARYLDSIEKTHILKNASSSAVRASVGLNYLISASPCHPPMLLVLREVLLYNKWSLTSKASLNMVDLKTQLCWDR